jgi:hypothetical protein
VEAQLPQRFGHDQGQVSHNGCVIRTRDRRLEAQYPFIRHGWVVGAIAVGALISLGSGFEASEPVARDPVLKSSAIAGSVRTSCQGLDVPAGSNLAAVASAHPPGTTFCLAAGTYNVATPIPFDRGDSFIGPPASTTPKWTPASETFWARPPSAKLVSTSGQPIFQKSLSGPPGAVTTFRFLDLSGAVDGAGGMIGQAIGGGGQQLLIDRSRIHHNIGPAVASWSGTIVDSELDHNGGAAGGHGGLKSVAGYAHATRIFYHHNLNGINCDFCNAANGDGPYSVVDSRITDNNAVGLKTEVSDVSTTFTGNMVLRNNLSDQTTAAGILVLSASNVLVSGNTFGGNLHAGLSARKDGRVDSMSNVRFQDNNMNGDAIVGCGRLPLATWLYSERASLGPGLLVLLVAIVGVGVLLRRRLGMPLGVLLGLGTALCAVLFIGLALVRGGSAATCINNA